MPVPTSQMWRFATFLYLAASVKWKKAFGFGNVVWTKQVILLWKLWWAFFLTFHLSKDYTQQKINASLLFLLSFFTSWGKRANTLSLCLKKPPKTNNLSVFEHEFVEIHVLFLRRIIHPPDRCGISRCWLNSVISDRCGLNWSWLKVTVTAWVLWACLCCAFVLCFHSGVALFLLPPPCGGPHLILLAHLGSGDMKRCWCQWAGRLWCAGARLTELQTAVSFGDTSFFVH